MCVGGWLLFSFHSNLMKDSRATHTHTHTLRTHTRPPSSGVWRVPLEAACALEERRLRRTFLGHRTGRAARTQCRLEAEAERDLCTNLHFNLPLRPRREFEYFSLFRLAAFAAFLCGLKVCCGFIINFTLGIRPRNMC